MSLMEKRRVKNFFVYIQNYDAAIPKTHEGIDINVEPFSKLVKKYGLEDNSVDFIGHALALNVNDDFMDKPAI